MNDLSFRCAERAKTAPRRPFSRGLATACTLASTLTLMLALGGGSALAQPQVTRRTTGSGYEVELDGALRAELGGVLRLRGTAYRVSGLADLAPAAGARVAMTLTKQGHDPGTRENVTDVTVAVGPGGHFEIALPVPDAAIPGPRVELLVGPAAAVAQGRRFEWNVELVSAQRLDLLTDRILYEPGETIHAWCRLTSGTGRAPITARNVRIVVTDEQGRAVGERVVATSAGGTATLDVPIAQTARDGSYRVQARVESATSGAVASRDVRVARRTVERLLVTTTLDQEVVAPGGAVTGRVVVTTPSGAPVVSARVEIRTTSGEEPTVVRTDREGVARIDVHAPAYLSGDVGTQTIDVRVVHAAHGTLRTVTTYLMSRVAWVIEATPQSGGLVPEVDTSVFLHVARPRGEAAPAGTQLTVTGPTVRGGSARVTTDRHGLAAFTARLPRGASSRGAPAGSGCATDEPGTSFDVSVDGADPFIARVCVRAAPLAQVAVRAISPVIAPGAELAFDVARRPEVRTAPLFAEALVGGRPLGGTWLAPNETRGIIVLPREVVGVVEVRVRPLEQPNARRPASEPGATALGIGASDAVLVRPANAFTLTVEPAQPVFGVRERAPVTLRTSGNPGDAWVALVARDVAAHGGEQPWKLAWIDLAVEEAVTNPSTPDAELLVRAALSAGLRPDSEPARSPPLVPPPWRTYPSGGYAEWQAIARGQVRDPVARREELLRRGLAPAMNALERSVEGLGRAGAQANLVVARSGNRSAFQPDVVAHLVDAHLLSDAQAKTLGDERLTVAMLTSADPSFTFDNVARRVARARLVRLLNALARFSDPDNAAAARASAGEPPARWLSRLVQLGLVASDQLIDPWGRPYAFRRVGAERAAIVVSDAAPDYELASAGPDGTFGNGDDIRNPYARVVPQGTPYAVASGEDSLARALAALGPGQTVLMRMVAAYARVGREAEEESRRGVVEASTSEATARAEAPPPVQAASPATRAPMGGMGRGLAASAGDMDDGAMAEEQDASGGEGGLSHRSRNRADEARQARRPAPDEPEPAPGASRLATLGERIRERFPATLFFLGEVRLDAGGATSVTIPLEDALTTYKLEAIAWTSNGWTASGSGELRVDQDAMVDAPVPPFATAGDRIRIPVRVQNRTAHTLEARVEVAAEGGVRLTAPAPVSVSVPANDAAEVVLEIVVPEPSRGALVVRAVRASNGTPLDAVRRPIVVLHDARPVRVHDELLAEGALELDLSVPEDATPLGPGELRVAAGARLFGDPATWTDGSLTAAWALAFARTQIPEAMREVARDDLTVEDEDAVAPVDPLEAAAAIAIVWRDRSVSDARVRAGLRAVSQLFDGAAPTRRGRRPVPQPGTDVTGRAASLVALSPAVRDLARRPGVRADLDSVVSRLRDEVSALAPQAQDRPSVWALGAAALALTSPRGPDARAIELLRRLDRETVTVGDETWLDSESEASTVASRVSPTALVALARAAVGDRAAAMPLLRHLARRARTAPRWSAQSRALASAAGALVSGGPVRGALHVTLDGHDVAVRTQDGVTLATLEGTDRPGTHRLRVDAGRGTIAIAWVDVRYGRPWNAPSSSPAPISIETDGELGARDTRSALRLTVRNRGTRVLMSPIVEVDMPAGAELDEPTREALTALSAAAPTIEGRTLRLRLRPIAPGGLVRIPLPVRWSVGGRLRGLGVTAYDDALPGPSGGERPTAIVESRAVELADHGDEPRAREPEASPPPVRPIPPPPPFPLEPVARRRVAPSRDARSASMARTEVAR